MTCNTVHIVNASGVDIRPFDAEFAQAYKTGSLPDELADLFTLTFLRAYNPDGSDRMIIAAA